MTSTAGGTQSIAPGIEVIDLEYLDEPRSVATVFITGTSGIALIDPGPSTTLPVVRRRLAERGASVADITDILLTHIHLDHAGAVGALIRENERITVHVHERGAPHTVDPSRLLRSATRIYGDQMERLWGEVLPVPAAHLHPLGAQDSMLVVGRRIRSAYTPGHAWHHVSYLDEESGVAFVGDTAGERYPGERYVLPVTPPPDVDLEQWKASSARIGAWHAAQLVVTHFGAFPDPARHLAEHEERLWQWALTVQRSLAEGGTDAERADRFATAIGVELDRVLPPQVAAHYRGSVRSSWDGLARYWRTRDEAAAGGQRSVSGH
jgi:glyoxylase-like metal-dependent hydrolase (beta-lactamase superfamily II)